ncbi:MAG: hypothetical protein HQL91_08855 [Magnetococcales bacterium]|nr:hypothetical protein [Magnetococcales bacterium]
MDQEQTLYVTGANAAYFPMLCVLQGAFQLYMPHLRLLVCDFGLTPGQARFLAAKKRLLPKPEDLASGRHVYYYKGCMQRYVAHLEFTALVWIDCDCLPVGPLDQAMHQLRTEHGLPARHLLASIDPVAADLGTFLRQHGATVAPFARLMAEAPIPLDRPYLNGGLFRLADRATLVHYDAIMQRLTDHFLFDQNAFNHAVHAADLPTVLLDPDLWNISGSRLDGLTCEEQPNSLPTFLYGGQRVWNLHISDDKAQNHVQLVALDLPVDGGYLRGLLREPKLAVLRQLIHDILQFYLFHQPENRRLLTACGALET